MLRMIIPVILKAGVMAEEEREDAYCGADHCDRQEGKAPALHAQQVQRADIGGVQRTCSKRQGKVLAKGR